MDKSATGRAGSMILPLLILNISFFNHSGLIEAALPNQQH